MSAYCGCPGKWTTLCQWPYCPEGEDKDKSFPDDDGWMSPE